MHRTCQGLFLASAFAVALATPSPSHADALVPGPAEAGYDAELADRVDGMRRGLHGIMNLTLGWGLEAFVADPADRALVEAFIASGEEDFEQATGAHPYEVVDRFGEHGDLGMFGGVQAAGDAFRYAVLRDEGADAATVDRARERLIATMQGLHWYTQVTGEPGLMARGIMRKTSEAGEPPIPDPIPETTPLFDGQGNPLPEGKTATWREDNSGELPFLVWLDDTSKDQVDGYIFALGAVYDVVASDPTMDGELVEQLVEDARAIGQRLMEKVEVAPERELDLVLQDADGRPTTFHDLNPQELTAGVVMLSPINGFNAWMALSIMRTLFHISGDAEIGRFYHEQLIQERDYLGVTRDTIVAMYTGADTNFSNVNMAVVAAYGLLRYENDPELALLAREIFVDHLYAPGTDREPAGLGQAFFDFIFAGFDVGGGSGSAGAAAVERGMAMMREHPAAPYWDVEVLNCDETELASLDCYADDGTPLPLSAEKGWNGRDVAVDPVPMRLRPPTNFQWRSDPHSVNGGGGTRLNPGGGYYAAYWLGRFLQASSSGLDNLSPIARDLPPPPTEEPPPAAEAAGDGCACRQGSAPHSRWGWLGLFATLVLPWRRRRR